MCDCDTVAVVFKTALHVRDAVIAVRVAVVAVIVAVVSVRVVVALRVAVV